MRIQSFLPLLLVWALTACQCTVPQKSEFARQLDRAMALARQYGPVTEAVAVQVAESCDGEVTDINYKSRESAERKCKTESCTPFDLKDLARISVVARWDSADVREVVEYLIGVSQEQNLFGRYKHQTSDYGYWGDLVNLQFDSLMTEIQVKTFGMFYAADPEQMVRATIGDQRYEYIHSYTGVEPGQSHIYYEIMRADTSSEATISYYKQLSREYYKKLQNIPNPNK